MRTARAAERLAPAKVNLFLHVGPRAGDGYHPVCSLMVFADIGDRLRIEPSARIEFEIVGPFAGELEGGADNLVPRARDRWLAKLDGAAPPFRLTLDKRLPIAAGLGGGSADAAATLNLLAEVLGDPATPDRGGLETLARELGADVAACLASRPVIVEGRGDRLTPAPAMPPLDAVLANPGAPSSTRAVYGAFDEAPSAPMADRPDPPPAFRSARDVANFLRACRNDLEASAIALQPPIGEALAAMRAEPETLLARMSGSGATCFSLCADGPTARALAGRLARAHPAWWVRACRLGGAAQA